MKFPCENCICVPMCKGRVKIKLDGYSTTARDLVLIELISHCFNISGYLALVHIQNSDMWKTRRLKIERFFGFDKETLIEQGWKSDGRLV